MQTFSAQPSPVDVQTPHSPSGAIGLCGVRVGEMVGEYRIDRPLGRGGSGVVFAAWDTARNCPVAVKVLGAAIETPTLFARFQREAITAARLRHPGIVGLYGVGVWGVISCPFWW